VSDGCTEATSQVKSPTAPIPGSTNPYVFIVGAARSGTTLLQRMLDAHPLVAVVNETYWSARKPAGRVGLTADGLVTPGLIPELLAWPKFERMGLGPERLEMLLEKTGPVPYAEFVSSLYEQFAADRCKPLAGDKTPGYVRRMSLVHRLWPRAKFLHLVRDGRDLCLSMLDWADGVRAAGRYRTWADDPVTTTAMYWRLSVLMGRESGAELGPDLYHEIHHEWLCAAPGETCAALCDFLHLPFDEAMVRFHEGRTKAGRSSKAKWLPPTPGLRDWRSQMSADDVGRFEEASGDVLDALGYERAGRRPSRSVLNRAARLRDAFATEVLAAGRRLPAGW
jgi:Sulfotransferase family